MTDIHPSASRGALFDLNGTVVDDMHVHGEIWREVAREYGRDLPASVFIRDWAGAKYDEVLRRIVGRPLEDAEVRSVLSAREERYRSLFPSRVREVAGCSAFVMRLRAAGMPLAIATSSPRAAREFVLRALGLESAFDRVVGAESVTRGKPAPDLFLAAAAALGVPPQTCVVFEDAVAGIEAARAAGMRAVGVASVLSTGELLEAGATWAITDFLRIPDDLLAALGLAVA
ncbi:MAG TPA: HAD family phosphatase [Anaeromyxobacteraceae bacterium]|nr:HAD family phosphatase [Anaeromyxobacteraceae bacterium]